MLRIYLIGFIHKHWTNSVTEFGNTHIQRPMTNSNVMRYRMLWGKRFSRSAPLLFPSSSDRYYYLDCWQPNIMEHGILSDKREYMQPCGAIVR